MSRLRAWMSGVCLLQTLAQPTYAAGEVQVFDHASEKVRLVRYESEGLLISEGCAWSTGSKCGAYVAFLRAKNSNGKIRIRTRSGATPGGAVCRSFQGRTMLVRDAQGNELALCQFSDTSLISQDSLFYQMKNIQKIELE